MKLLVHLFVPQTMRALFGLGCLLSDYFMKRIHRTIIILLHLNDLKESNKNYCIMFLNLDILSFLEHLPINFIVDSVNQQVMEDVAHIGRPVEEQLEEHFL